MHVPEFGWEEDGEGEETLITNVMLEKIDINVWPVNAAKVDR